MAEGTSKFKMNTLSLNKDYLKAGLIALLVGLVYIPTFIWMWDRWFVARSYYSHGILIPLVVAFLIYFKRDEIASAASRPPLDFKIVVIV